MDPCRMLGIWGIELNGPVYFTALYKLFKFEYGIILAELYLQDDFITYSRGR